ncbi:MAG: GTPase Era [Clostridia bacterium]|nr:GTPase Era [Clostridia bacterium]MBR5773127.1 GTPase Era [Clostridia bacterium]
MTKTSFIAIVGCPNVGKSSILNKLLGKKVAIVTQKPQTTRTRIVGVLTKGETQFVFTDTPGYHRPKNKLGEKMIRAVGEGISGTDACLFVTEAEGEINEREKELLQRLKKENAPVILALNKTDLVKDKEKLMKKILDFTSAYDFEAVVPVSALNGDNLDALMYELEKTSYPSVHFFPDDTLTDQPERVIAAELIREKMLLLLDKEIPHGVAVSIEKMRERAGSDIMDVEALIYCEKESHKGIIIGKKGDMLKKISTRARIDMENFFCCKINLQCWVKVKEDWRNREGLIRNFGLD